jgi:hypothetical protein
MAKERIKLAKPNVREYAHGLAYELVRERLAAIADIREQCRRCDAEHRPPENAVILNYLNRPYRIGLPDAGVTPADGEGDVPMRDKILILHYFTQAKGTPLTGRMITYKELPDGINYFPVFAKRAIRPVVSYFGAEPQRLPEAAAALGGRPADYGDVAVTIDVFSRAPVTLVLWKGDDEFAPEGSIMFDSTINDYLTNDDIHTLCESIVWRLVRLLKTGGDSPGRK